MKKIKFIVIVMFCLSFSLESFADDSIVSAQEKAPDMSLYEEDHENFKSEMTFEEEMGIDITNEDLESTLQDAFASR